MLNLSDIIFLRTAPHTRGRCLVFMASKPSGSVTMSDGRVYVTMPQIGHNACWCWRNTSDLIPQIRARCADAVVQYMVAWGANERFNKLQKILIFPKQFLRPHQSGVHGTRHVCHTLDTPLSSHLASLETSSSSACHSKLLLV